MQTHEHQTLAELVDRLESGDEFQVFAGEFIVDDVHDCESRPIVYVRKKSLGSYMDRRYRLEHADPTDDEDETLVIRTKYTSHWSEWSRFAPEKVEREDADRTLVADGSGDVFEDGTATTCPDCEGDLQYQNRQSIVCLGCNQDFEHWKNSSSHHLVEVDEWSGGADIVHSTPRLTGGDV